MIIPRRRPHDTTLIPPSFAHNILKLPEEPLIALAMASPPPPNPQLSPSAPPQAPTMSPARSVTPLAPIELLPLELALAIFHLLPSPDTLRSLLLVSRTFYSLYRTQRAQIAASCTSF